MPKAPASMRLAACDSSGGLTRPRSKTRCGIRHSRNVRQGRIVGFTWPATGCTPDPVLDSFSAHLAAVSSSPRPFFSHSNLLRARVLRRYAHAAQQGARGGGCLTRNRVRSGALWRHGVRVRT